jgi:hypothetical protein
MLPSGLGASLPETSSVYPYESRAPAHENESEPATNDYDTEQQ